MRKTIMILSFALTLPAFAGGYTSARDGGAPDTDRMREGANPNQRPKMTYKVENLDCVGCDARVQNAVRKVPGVSSAKVDAAKGEVSLTVDGQTRVDEAAVVRAIENEGFRVAR